MSDEECLKLMALLRTLNPSAEVIPTVNRWASSRSSRAGAKASCVLA